MTPGLCRRVAGFVLAAIALAAGAPALAQASAPAAPRPRSPAALRRAGAAREAGVRWQSLTPAQRQALAPLEREWSGHRRPAQAEVAADRRALSVAAAAGARPDHRADERMGPAHARRARRDAPALPGGAAGAGAGPLGKWEEYQNLPPDTKQQLAARAAASAAPAKADARAGPKAVPSPRDGNQAKANVVPNPALAQRPKPVAPTVVQAAPGATTRLITRPVTPPEHQQSGMPKIAATPEFVNRSTLLPKRGPQAAAVAPSSTQQPLLRPDAPRRQAGRADPDPIDPAAAARRRRRRAAGRGRRAAPALLAANDLLRLRGDAAVRHRPGAGGTGHPVLRPDRTKPPAAERRRRPRLRAGGLRHLFRRLLVGARANAGDADLAHPGRRRRRRAPRPGAGAGPLRRLLRCLVRAGDGVAVALHLGPWPTLGAVVLGIVVYALLALAAPGRQFWHDSACGTRLVDTRGEPAPVRDAQTASSSVSPVRMRTTCSTAVTKILPSPILPVRAALTMASIAALDHRVRRPRPRSSPWAGSRPRTRRRDRARCGPSAGRSP